MRIVFILSHWPSRQWLPPRDPDRDTFGAQLRAAHVRIKEDTNVQHVVFAGDYNDEPFDEPLFAHLTATRDPSRLMASEFVIYNPFWRALGTHEAYLGAHPKRRVSGSYRYTSGRHTNWYTFDQMMFSREFLLGDAWRLCETETGILADERLVELLYDRANRIDHLPVISVIEAHTND